MKNLTNNKIIKIIFITILFIIPIIFFGYANYISISAFAAHMYAFENSDIATTAKYVVNLYNMYLIEYLIYLGILLFNYICYKKKWTKVLLIINLLLFIISIIDFISIMQIKIDYLLFLFANIIGFIWYIKLKKN